MTPKLRLGFAVPLLAFAALGVWSLGMKQVRLLVGGVRGAGVVERVEEITTSTRTKRDRYGNSESDSSQATFLHLAVTTADGGVVRAKTRTTFNTPAQVGDTYPVIYLPSAPEKAQILSARQFWLPMVVGSVVTLGCAVAGGWLMASCRRTGGRVWRTASPVPESSRFVPPVRSGGAAAGRGLSARGRRFLGHVAAHAIGFFVCIVVPVLVTWTAPVARVALTREAGTVTAQARTCLLFVIPFRSATVSPVTSVGHRKVAGSMTRTARSGRNEYHKSEDQGYLELKGPNGSTEVPVTPHDLEDVKAQVAEFLNDPAQDSLSLFVVANWKFSVFGGGLVSMMTVLYLTAVVATVVRGVWRLFVPRRAAAGAGELSRRPGPRVSVTGD